MISGVAARLRRPAVTAALVALLVTGVCAARNGAGLALATRQPDAALRANGENAIAQAQMALVTIQAEDASGLARGKALALAKSSIARDALNPTALAVVGLASGDDRAALRAFTASQALSRRSLPAQLGLIEYAVARGNVAEALRHYDTALRTSGTAPSLLFPVLVEAATDPTLRPELARTLARRPAWGGLYLQQLAQSGRDPAATAALYVELLRYGVDPGTAATGALYTRLMAAGAYDTAWSVYAAANPKAARGGLRDGTFAAAPDVPTPFDWVPSDAATASARVEREDGGGRLVFTAAAGEGGEVARQLLLLTPGSHRVAVATERVDAPAEARPYLRVTCATGGAELGRVALSGDADRGGRSLGAVTVPAGCRAQWLTLIVPPPPSMEAIEGTVTRVTVG